MKKKNKRFEFSKIILILETFLVLYISYEIINITKQCIDSQFLGSLPFLTTMISTVWAAFGTSVSFYYKKAEHENIPKVTTSMEIEKAEALAKLNTEEESYEVYDTRGFDTTNIDCDTL